VTRHALIRACLRDATPAGFARAIGVAIATARCRGRSAARCECGEIKFSKFSFAKQKKFSKKKKIFKKQLTLLGFYGILM
jgi:hypothetical protein